MSKLQMSFARMRASSRFAGPVLAAALTALVPPAAQAVQGNADAGRNKNSMCEGCHGISGYKASYPRVYSVPKISGQSAKYIENALAEYKKGARSHPTMRAIAGSLSEQDMADLAAYYASR